ncbi:uncharacterized protein EAE98_008972 [Botrytis deweyae]|uniref:Integral membrane protein n=1 Tax=Botrytis deweyae TaxID=2478750 RepID=A0ABQ7ICM4_9HELO|nr:uncharacterized protein EAE98_008972 [Botrytis deweyae]KAF7920279.1 hypothetical protein EAE98_008972 [Botrytis deweyae]
MAPITEVLRQIGAGAQSLAIHMSDQPKFVLENIPSLTPPPGIMSNFQHRASRRESVIVVSTLLMALGSICICIRAWAKLVNVRPVKSLWKIFFTESWVKIACTFGAIISSIFYTIHLILALIWGIPRNGVPWRHQMLWDSFFRMQTLSLPRATVGFTIDTHVIIIPLIAVSKSKLTPRKKIGVGLIFATGFIATIGSIPSTIYRLRLDDMTIMMMCCGILQSLHLSACILDISRFVCMYRGRFKYLSCSLLSFSGCRNMIKTRNIRKLTKLKDNSTEDSVQEDENKHEKRSIRVYPGLDISETPHASASNNSETPRPLNGNEMP